MFSSVTVIVNVILCSGFISDTSDVISTITSRFNMLSLVVNVFALYMSVSSILNSTSYSPATSVSVGMVSLSTPSTIVVLSTLVPFSSTSTGILPMSVFPFSSLIVKSIIVFSNVLISSIVIVLSSISSFSRFTSILLLPVV